MNTNAEGYLIETFHETLNNHSETLQVVELEAHFPWSMLSPLANRSLQ